MPEFIKSPAMIIVIILILIIMLLFIFALLYDVKIGRGVFKYVGEIILNALLLGESILAGIFKTGIESAANLIPF